MISIGHSYGYLLLNHLMQLLIIWPWQLYDASVMLSSDLEVQVTQKAAALTMTDVDTLVLEPDGDYVGKCSLIVSCNSSLPAL
jgi:hypothetical protein